MRVVNGMVAGLACLGASACVLDPSAEHRLPRVPDQTGAARIDPYHRDKIPDTPYEVRKAEMERDDHLAGRTGPTYPPLFKDQKDEEDTRQ